MKKGMLLCMLLMLSGTGYAADQVYTGPDCSNKETDNFSRLETGLEQSFDHGDTENKKFKKYISELTSKGVTIKKTRLSSEKVSLEDAKRLMMRRAKKDGLKTDKIPESGIDVQYLKTDLYRQYYLIESSAGFKAIVEYYTSVANKGSGPEAVSCGADLGNIYVVSDQIEGHTDDFASR